MDMERFHEAVDDIGVQAPPGVFFSSWVDPSTGLLKVTLNRWDDETVAKMRAAVPNELLEITVDPSARFESLGES